MTMKTLDQWQDNKPGCSGRGRYNVRCLDCERAWIAAIQADARNAALEEAAEVADDHRVVCDTKCGGWDGAACDGAIAGAIRALKNPADGG